MLLDQVTARETNRYLHQEQDKSIPIANSWAPLGWALNDGTESRELDLYLLLAKIINKIGSYPNFEHGGEDWRAREGADERRDVGGRGAPN